MTPYAVFSTEMRPYELLAPSWLRTTILLISASDVAGMAGVCHHQHLMTEMGLMNF
jgi:hypothetical protein